MENNSKLDKGPTSSTGQQGGFPGVISGKQFEQFLFVHKRAIIYAAVTQNVVQSGTTATPKNLQRIKDVAEAVLELMG